LVLCLEEGGHKIKKSKKQKEREEKLKKMLIVLGLTIVLFLINLNPVHASISGATYLGDVYDNGVGYTMSPTNQFIFSSENDAYFWSVAQGVTLYVSDDDGVTWANSGGGTFADGGGGTDYSRHFKPEFCYDSELEVVHVCQVADTSTSNDYIRYYHLEIEDDVATPTTNQWTISTGGGYGTSSACIIDQDNKVIIAGSYRNLTTWDYSLFCWFAQSNGLTASPSFTRYDFNLTAYSMTAQYIDMHLVAEDTVLILMTAQSTTPARVYGVYCTRSGGFGSRFVVSDSNANYWRDTNNHYFPTTVSYSENTYDPQDYGTELLLCYADDSKIVRSELFEIDVSGGDLDLISSDIVFDGSSYMFTPINIGISKDADSYFCSFQTFHTGYDWLNVSIAELNPITDEWEDYVTVLTEDNMHISGVYVSNYAISPRFYNVGSYYGALITTAYNNPTDKHWESFVVSALGYSEPEPTWDYTWTMIGLAGLTMVILGFVLPAWFISNHGFMSAMSVKFIAFGCLSALIGYGLMRTWLFGGFG